MMQLGDACEIMKNVRKYFATGEKYCNKAYRVLGRHGKEEDLSAIIAGLSAVGLPLRPKRGLSGTDRRNGNVALAIPRIYALRDAWNGGTAVEYGDHIHTKAIRYGNCTEMACVAAHFVAEEDPSEETPISIVTTDGPGDHVFCALGPVFKWQKIDDPPQSARRAIVIDPWANICCLAPQYFEQFTERMNLWLTDGKRIAASRNRWISPDRSYLSALEKSKLDIRNARNSPPFTK